MTQDEILQATIGSHNSLKISSKEKNDYVPDRKLTILNIVFSLASHKKDEYSNNYFFLGVSTTETQENFNILKYTVADFTLTLLQTLDYKSS